MTQSLASTLPANVEETKPQAKVEAAKQPETPAAPVDPYEFLPEHLRAAARQKDQNQNGKKQTGGKKKR
jgi:hypothetical protein